jgi:hypothetical protein
VASRAVRQSAGARQPNTSLESRSTVGVWIEQQLAAMARQRPHVHLRQIQLVDERVELLQMQRIFRDLRRTNLELATFFELATFLS